MQCSKPFRNIEPNSLSVTFNYEEDKKMLCLLKWLMNALILPGLIGRRLYCASYKVSKIFRCIAFWLYVLDCWPKIPFKRTSFTYCTPSKFSDLRRHWISQGKLTKYGIKKWRFISAFTKKWLSLEESRANETLISL